MIKGKAGLRALRESCGLTQGDVAEEFGVKILSVKRWENPDQDRPVPDDVWGRLLDLRREIASRASAVARKAAGDLPAGGQVALPYFRTREDLCRAGGGEGLIWSVGCVNAIMRLAALELERAGYEVAFDYGSGNRSSVLYRVIDF